MTRIALVALVVAGCGGGGGGPADAVPDSSTWTGDDLRGACPLAARVGGFVVESGGNAPTVYGSVADGVLPVSVLTELAAAGDCVLVRRENPFCDPPCTTSETCGLDGACVPYPVNQSAGTVAIAGLTAPLAMEPDATDAYANLTATEPLFAPGALIQLDAAGADVARFTLRGIGVADLALASNNIVIMPGADLTVAYTASGTTDGRLYLTLEVDQHGLAPAALQCKQPDTGSIVVPASLVDGLLDLGQSGVPNAYVSRRTTDSATVGAGCVDFTVSETVPPNQIHVSVEGVHYCTPPMQCPPPETCNPSTLICE